MYISYGPKGNADLLLLYGFSLDRNPYNSVDVQIALDEVRRDCLVVSSVHMSRQGDLLERVKVVSWPTGSLRVQVRAWLRGRGQIAFAYAASSMPNTSTHGSLWEIPRCVPGCFCNDFQGVWAIRNQRIE